MNMWMLDLNSFFATLDRLRARRSKRHILKHDAPLTERVNLLGIFQIFAIESPRDHSRWFGTFTLTNGIQLFVRLQRNSRQIVRAPRGERCDRWTCRMWCITTHEVHGHQSWWICESGRRRRVNNIISNSHRVSGKCDKKTTFHRLNWVHWLFAREQRRRRNKCNRTDLQETGEVREEEIDFH